MLPDIAVEEAFEVANATRSAVAEALLTTAIEFGFMNYWPFL